MSLAWHINPADRVIFLGLRSAGTEEFIVKVRDQGPLELLLVLGARRKEANTHESWLQDIALLRAEAINRLLRGEDPARPPPLGGKANEVSTCSVNRRLITA